MGYCAGLNGVKSDCGYSDFVEDDPTGRFLRVRFLEFCLLFHFFFWQRFTLSFGKLISVYKYMVLAFEFCHDINWISMDSK